MIDFRLYRLAFIPALLAVVVVMFSLEGAPDPLEPVTPPSTFEGDRAATLAQQIAKTAPDRSPGSPGDAATADLVADRFGEIPAGVVSEQRFDASYAGDTVSLRNVLLTLPGDAEATIVIAAPRDSADAPGAASSAASTGILIELADAFRVSHEKTFVLASTSGTLAGGAGVRELVDSLPERASIEAVIVISQPGSGNPQGPYVVSSSAGDTSASVQLERTAERAVESQAQLSTSEEGAFTQLSRLAIPSGLGDQAPLIAGGTDAVAISSAGERPLEPSADGPEDVSAESIDAFGRAVQSTVSALDVVVAGPIHGPTSHLELGDNLVPGWALAALALALILPAAVAAVDACARGARRDLAVAPGLAWAAARSLPFIGGLAVLYGLAIVGVVPRPPFPFDPGGYELGTRAAITFALIAIAALASVVGLRSRRVTGTNAPSFAIAAIGAVAVAASVAVWLANPYLGLLLVPASHVWLLATAEQTPLRRAAILIATALACLPAVAAAVAVAGALDLGGQAPWTFALMLADGQLGLVTAVSVCFLVGALVGGAAIAISRGAAPDQA